MQTAVRPIFILGMLRRSGTNYLSDLLVQHRDCISAAPVHEDHLVQRAGHLLRYVDAVTGSWTTSWGVPPETRGRLLRSLGDGIVSFLQADAGDLRVVTKTPRLENLDRFFDLFPSVPLLLIVRDGRNVVASNVRSFDVNEEAARQEWASAGRAILDFDARNRGSGLPYRVVRYEDLLDDLESTMTEVLRCCDLDPDGFDLAAARALPLRGSSTVRRDGADVHWEPVAKDDAFRPKERWREWTSYQHARFAEVAGDVQRAFGYPLESAARPTASDRLHGRVDGTTWMLRRLRRRLRPMRS